MEIRSILVGAVIGLLIGAGVNLMIYVPALTQINDLQDQVSNLETQITDKNDQIANLSDQITQLRAELPPERKGAYNLVAAFAGRTDGSTDYFYLDEPDIMVAWNWTGTDILVISLWQQNASTYTASWTNVPRNGSSYVHNVQTAYYYLNIAEALNLASWNVSIYKWVPT